MKKLTTTVCLTVAFVIGFNTMASSQRFEAGKTYGYNEELPDTDTVQRVVIKVGENLRTYEATIYSGKYKYACRKGVILPSRKLTLVQCEPIDEMDADNILIGNDWLNNPKQEVSGTLYDPYRSIMVYTMNGCCSSGDAEGEKRYHFKMDINDPAPTVQVKPKVKQTPPKVKKDPLSQKLVTLKALLKGGLITQKDYNTKRAAILKEMSGEKVNPIVRKLKQIQQLLDQKLITPADAKYKRRKILDDM